MSDPALDDVVVEVREKAFGRKPEGTRYIGLEHIAPGSPRIIGTAPSSYSDGTNGVFASGDILFGKLRPYLRKSVQADLAGYCSTDVMVLRARSGVDQRYAAHLLRSEEVFRHAEANSFGTKMPRTSWNLVRRLRVFLPELDQQRRIAEILDTIDEAIRTSEQIVLKLKDLRIALLVDTVWAVSTTPVAIGDLGGRESDVVIGPFGSDLTASDYRSEGVPVIFVQDVRPGEVVQHRSRVFVSPSKADSLARHRIEAGDIAVTKMGLPPGLAAVYPDGMPPGVVTADIVRVRCRKDDYDPRFVVEAINSPMFQGQVRAITGGVTRPKITLRDFRTLQVSVPRLDTQRDLLSPLRALDKRIRLEVRSLSAMCQVREGLRTDLLSGRVRTLAP